jgi:hypothetical protein
MTSGRKSLGLEMKREDRRDRELTAVSLPLEEDGVAGKGEMRMRRT